MQAKKRFGQHFLEDHLILDKIVKAISPKANDHIVEIGPGRGALTHYLFPYVQQLSLIEIDRDLIKLLHQKYQNSSNIHIYQADILKFNWEELNASSSLVKGKLRVVGNLPYNISTPLLVKLFKEINYFQDMHFLLQYEVAARLCAAPGSKAYGRLSVLCQFYCQPELLFEMGPEVFNPPPKVRSALVRFNFSDRHSQNDLIDKEVFFEIVKLAFMHRRKTLANNLKTIMPAAMLSAIGIEPNARPQELTINDFMKIGMHYPKKSS